MKEPATKAFGHTIQRLIERHDLTEQETFDAFVELLDNVQPDLQQGAFLAALAAKGETADEIAGAWRAILERDTVPAHADLPRPLIENSGTGMDRLKTFNVSSAAAVVAAACGARVARHGARALTSFSGTVDILEAVGLDVECTPACTQDSIRRAGIGLFNGMSAQVHPAALGRILSQIRFGSTLNIAASLANPARPERAVRGVHSEALVPRVAGVMRRIGMTHGWVVHGMDDRQAGGMDELSVSGPTRVCTFGPDGEASFTLRPADAGLGISRFEDLAATGDRTAERRRFLTVLAGRGPQACADFTCLNAAAVLLVAGVARDLADGVTRSQGALASGAAEAKLREWIAAQSADPARSVKRFDGARHDAGLP